MARSLLREDQIGDRDNMSESEHDVEVHKNLVTSGTLNFQDGTISGTGDVYATTFYGDGSELTGISGGWSGGTSTYMLYNDVSGDLAETADMTYDVSTGDINLGSTGEARVEIDADTRLILYGDDNSYLTISGTGGSFTDGGDLRMSITEDGLALENGGRVNEILVAADGLSASSTDTQLATTKLIYDHVNTISGSLGGGGISNVVEDTSPELGGDLDTGAFTVSGTGDIYAATFYGDGSELTGISGGGGLENIVEDTTPELGGDLDTGAFTVSGTGDVYCDDLYTSGVTVHVGDGQVGSTAGNIELFHAGDKVFETTVTSGINVVNEITAVTYYGDGSELTGISAGLSNIVEDTTPELGGDLILGSYTLKSATGGGKSQLVLSESTDTSLQSESGVSAAAKNLYVRGGVSDTSTGGKVYVTGGAGLIGADVFLTGGASSAGSGGYGGDIYFKPGTSFNNSGGFATLVAPTGSTSSPSFEYREAAVSGTKSISLRAPVSVETDRTWTLPQDDPSTADGKFLTTDSSGVMSFADVSVSYPLLAPNGGLTVPSYSFANDTDTGFYLGTAGVMNLTIGSTKVIEYASTQINIQGSARLTLAAGQIRASSTLSAATAPAYSFYSDTNTGFFSPSADDVGVSLGGYELFRFEGGDATSATNGVLHLYEAPINGSNSVSLQAPISVATSRTWTLPQDDPTTASGQFLTTNSSGVLSFADAGGGISEVVEDTSPELGGDLDTAAFTISGTGDIYCDDLYTSGVTVHVGDGQVGSTAGNIELYHAGGKALTTTSGGIILTGQDATTSGSIYFEAFDNTNGSQPSPTHGFWMLDPSWGKVGFHLNANGGCNFRNHQMNGTFSFQGYSTVGGANHRNMITMNPDNGVVLNVDGTTVLDVAASGIDVTGDITLTGTVDGIDIATDVAANTNASHTAGTDTALGTMAADINMNSSYQVVGLQAPAALGEAIRQTATITEANLNALTDTSVTALHFHNSLKDGAVIGARTYQSGPTELNWIGVKKLATSATGVSITGEVIADQVTNLNAPDALKEAIRQTATITEINLNALTGAGETALHSHAGGGGDVAGPASSLDNAITRYHLTTGKIIQDSLTLLDDTGNIQFPTTTGLKDAAGNQAIAINSAEEVELYYNNVKAVETMTGGIRINPENVNSAQIRGNTGSVELYDNQKLAFATAGNGTIKFYNQDQVNYAQIYTSTNLTITHTHLNGGVVIQGTDSGGAKTLFAGYPTSGTLLYYQGVKAITTQAEGITVFDTSGDTPAVYLNSDGNIQQGALISVSGNLGLWGLVNGGDVSLKQMNSIGGLETILIGHADGAVELYYDNTKTFETSATGATLTGELIAGQVTGLNAPDASGEAIRTTTNITEVNLLALTGAGETALHSHAGGGGLANIVEDTTPELGGDLDSGAFTISGTGDIYCDDLYTSGDTIHVADGQIKSTAGNIELYDAGDQVLTTTSGGIILASYDADDSATVGIRPFDIVAHPTKPNNTQGIWIFDTRTPDMRYGIHVHPATGDVNTRAWNPGSSMSFQGYMTAEPTAHINMILASPNAGVQLAWAGATHFATNSNGISVYDGSAMDFDILDDGDAGGVKLINNVDDQYILLRGHVSSVAKNMIVAYPQSFVELYYTGLQVAKTQSLAWCPSITDTRDLGNGSLYWDDIYATNGTIITSDGRRKTTVSGTDLGLDFINGLNPVSFTFIDYDYEYEQPTDSGTITISGSKTHHRRHYGLIAQDVEATLSGIGKDTEDFAGYIRDEEADTYSLRYTEFIAPMVKAIQELTDIVNTQQATISGLEDRIEALESA